MTLKFLSTIVAIRSTIFLKNGGLWELMLKLR